MARKVTLGGFKFEKMVTDDTKVAPELRTVFVAKLTPVGKSRQEYVRLARDRFDTDKWRLDTSSLMFLMYESDVNDSFASLEDAANEVARRYSLNA